MDIPNGYRRVSRRMIPNYPCLCTTQDCPYNGYDSRLDGTGQAMPPKGTCINPDIHKGNSDALCHDELNRDLLARLHPIPQQKDAKGAVVQAYSEYAARLRQLPAETPMPDGTTVGTEVHRIECHLATIRNDKKP